MKDRPIKLLRQVMRSLKKYFGMQNSAFKAMQNKAHLV